MAVTGVFTADFSSFDKAVQTSTKNLEGLEGGAQKAESSLRLMTQTQEQMLNQIGASGGRIQELSEATEGAAGSVNTLNQSYRQFDGLLQSAGVNIGPQIKGLEDIAAAAGKTVAQFGLLGTAGAVVGTALTAWDLGKWIGEVTGLTQGIEDLTASWMGLGNVATETAGAKQDVINRAIAQGAKETISYTEAIKFNTEAAQRNADAKINWRERLADAHREVRNLTDAQKAEIAIALEAGAKVEELTAKYGIHALGLKILAAETDKAAAAQARLTAEHQKDLADAERRERANQKGIEQMEYDARLMADRAKFDEEQLAITNQKLAAGKGYVEQMGEIARANHEAATAEAARLGDQDRMTAANDALVASMLEQNRVAAEVEAANEGVTESAWHMDAAYQGLTMSVEMSKDAIEGWIELMKFTNASNALLNQNSLFTTTSTLENQARLGTAFSPIPGFAGGIENFGGGLAKVHGGEVLANLPAGTSVFPKGSGFGGAQVSNVFNLVDTESNLARRVAELIMRQVRAGTQLGTA